MSKTSERNDGGGRYSVSIAVLAADADDLQARVQARRRRGRGLPTLTPPPPWPACQRAYSSCAATPFAFCAAMIRSARAWIFSIRASRLASLNGFRIARRYRVAETLSVFSW